MIFFNLTNYSESGAYIVDDGLYISLVNYDSVGNIVKNSIMLSISGTVSLSDEDDTKKKNDEMKEILNELFELKDVVETLRDRINFDNENKNKISEDFALELVSRVTKCKK